MATDAHEFKRGFADNISRHVPRTPDQLRAETSLTSTIGELAIVQLATTGVKISNLADNGIPSSGVYQLTGHIPRTTIPELFDAANDRAGFRII